MLYVVVLEDRDPVRAARFETEAERDAYMLGVCHGRGLASDCCEVEGAECFDEECDAHNMTVEGYKLDQLIKIREFLTRKKQSDGHR